jgi:hypothetical protein
MGVNNPANLERFEDVLDGLGTEKLRISFGPNFRAFPARAGISWMRSAYLAAFAVFGWRYALRPVFNALRDQLKAGKEADVPDLYRYHADADSQRREIIVAGEHPDCPCLVVAMGQHIVFLPTIGRTIPLTDLAAALKVAEGNGGTFTGLVAPWPTSPRYELDRLAEKRVRGG